MKLTKTTVILLSIVILAGILRFYKLSLVPPGLYWDEISLGYNAYSIAQTGKDEYGKRYPVSFRAFGDYKYPGYIYTTALSIKLFGRSDFAVRFPSALAGTLTVLMTYFLVRELFPRMKFSVLSFQLSVGEIAAFLLAISPWHLQFSRAGFEANLALFFLIAGWYSFLLFLKHRGIWLAISVVFFLFSAATYISTRLFAPLILATLVLISRRTMMKAKRELALAIVTGILLSLPFIPSIISGEGIIRAYSESIIGKEKLFPKIFENYLANFDTTFLFFKGDQNGRHSVRKLGMLYVFELPLILIGLGKLLKEKGMGKNMVFAWLLLAPISVSLSNINPHAIRTLHMLPAWEIISAVGAMEVVNAFRRQKDGKIRAIGFSMFAILIGYNILLYLHQYYIHYPRETALDWQNGIKQAVENIASHYNQYDKIFVSDTLPPLYIAFYLPVEPRDYQKFENPKQQMGKIQYFQFAKDIDKQHQSALIVAPGWQKPDEKTPYQKVNMINGDTIFNIWSRE